MEDAVAEDTPKDGAAADDIPDPHIFLFAPDPDVVDATVAARPDVTAVAAVPWAGPGPVMLVPGTDEARATLLSAVQTDTHDPPATGRIVQTLSPAEFAPHLAGVLGPLHVMIDLPGAELSALRALHAAGALERLEGLYIRCQMKPRFEGQPNFANIRAGAQSLGLQVIRDDRSDPDHFGMILKPGLALRDLIVARQEVRRLRAELLGQSLISPAPVAFAPAPGTPPVAPSDIPVRSLHHFACSGGTILSKCISLMPDVTLLSEIDPLSRHLRPTGTEPHKFHPTDVIYAAALVAQRPITQDETLQVFEASVAKLRDVLSARGSALVIRDHAHSHFCNPTDIDTRPTLRAILQQVGPTLSAVSVRHPLDSFLSIAANDWRHFAPFTLDEYARRYGLFLDAYQGQPLFYYEAFTVDPDAVLAPLCAALDIAFAPGVSDLAGSIMMSGDSGRRSEQIVVRPRRALPGWIARSIEDSPAYVALCHRLGYDPDVTVPAILSGGRLNIVPGPAPGAVAAPVTEDDHAEVTAEAEVAAESG